MRIKTPLLLAALFAVISFAQVKLQFVTVNQYGNNLYIDNVLAGTRFNTDVGIGSINNINPDTSYSIGSSAFTVAPKITVVNVGKQNITTPFNVTLTILPGVYSSVKSVTSLNSGQGQEVVFDNVTITPSQPINLTVTTSLTGDENPSNNTMEQYTLYLPGVQRNVILEEWTSSTCGPCASSNPTIDAFVSSHFDSLVVVKYHMNWPSPGNDPMYLYNPTQATDRRTYYGINAVPSVIMDGVVVPSGGFATGLPNGYYARRSVGAPLSISVNSTRLAGDTIQADVEVKIWAPLKAGNYYLRVQAIERGIHYSSAPGSNGEKDFYDVFRKAYPTSLGTSLELTPGTYNYTFKYKLDLPTWIDTSIYTNAFVQNDATKEMMNAGKSRLHVVKSPLTALAEPYRQCKPELAPDRVVASTIAAVSNSDNPKLSSSFYYKMFESQFPPAGWKIINPDNALTFSQFSGANGPTLGGTKSVTLQFYDYSSTGRADTLYSEVFNNLNGADTLTFDWAYAQYQSENDRLVVRLSKDGGLTYPYTIFDKAGSALATASATTNSFVPTSASQWKTFVYSLSQVFQTQITQPVNVKAGWNILSVPVAASNMTASTLFPDATSAFYGYNNGYTTLTTLVNGKGFWARFGTQTSYQITGGIVTASVPVTSGWNLIGAYDKNVVVSGITSTPANIVNSSYYGYNDGYTSATSLVPGQGYWVRVSQDGVLNLNTTLEKNGQNSLTNVIPDSWTALKIHDNLGRHSALYISYNNDNLSQFDLPPMPPAGIFDVRFADGRSVSSASCVNEIKLQSDAYPVIIQAENGSVEIKDSFGGKVINRKLNSGEELIINDQSVTSLIVNSINMPVEFNLSQNYPNPFNPSTQISYQIPVNSHVELMIYDPLGREVTRLVNGYQEAGRYSITVDASGLTSGVYFYAIKARNYNAIRKMIILK